MAQRMDRRDHRHVHIAGALAQQLRSLLLAAGRDRINVEIIGCAGEMRLDRAGSLETGGRRHRGNDHVGLGDRLGRRIRQPHADGLAGRFQPRAGRLGKENIPGGDALDAGFAQAGGDRLSGLAETDKGNARCVASGHGCPIP